MTGFVVRRVASSLVVLLAISLAVYLLFFGSAVDPARIVCGRPCQPERLTQIRDLMQTDRSAFAQWLDFLRGLVAGRTYGTGAEAIRCAAPCFGFSFDQRESVTTLIGQRLPVTASLALGGAALSLVVGMLAGPAAALHRNRFLDHAVRGVSITLLATPTYLLGLLAILVFGFQLNMVPVSGYVGLTDNPLEWLWHLVLPWIVIAALTGSGYARFARNQMLDELGSDHLLAQRATGAPRRQVVRSARRGVWVPVVTLFGLDLAALLGGAVFTERVFSMHGIGDLLIDGVSRHDLGVVVGTALFGAALVIVANLLVDVVHGLIDPRVRRG